MSHQYNVNVLKKLKRMTKPINIEKHKKIMDGNTDKKILKALTDRPTDKVNYIFDAHWYREKNSCLSRRKSHSPIALRTN